MKEEEKPEPRFRHMDGEKWHEVRAIQVGERRASVWEKWLDFTSPCTSRRSASAAPPFGCGVSSPTIADSAEARWRGPGESPT